MIVGCGSSVKRRDVAVARRTRYTSIVWGISSRRSQAGRRGRYSQSSQEDGRTGGYLHDGERRRLMVWIRQEAVTGFRYEQKKGRGR
ncbi:hypothetical protein M413DRAFT_206523 [Hebeloma cylindrosporum]|uniref:Uncharacterized protein n=1 Tax=Hebeloma cylindrosporum TaxID=76867 RepID=A0A0C3CG08_HEBCY|nr:hypothetical protein M413DRAFT_206523 [Hebeloma cylindrosporum h7]